MPEEKHKLSSIRNIGIVAHIDAGKTTTTESILYLTGETRKVGKVHEGDTVTDFDPQERKRGITIYSAAVEFFWERLQKKYRVNLIDTPGHVDFTAEVERSLRVLDGAVVVLDGSKGVQAQTETVWKQANKYKIPRLIFVNKMDNADNEEKFDECLTSIRERLNAAPLPVQFPIGVGKDLKGVVDVIEQKAYYFQTGDRDENYQIKEIPPELLKKTRSYRQYLIEKIIEFDENLGMKYLESQDLQTVEVRKLLRQATLTGTLFPLFCGSAYRNVGVKMVLDGTIDYLPSPLEVGEIPVFSPQSKKQEGLINCDSPVSCLALAFKVVIDEYNNRWTFLRVYAGKILANSYVWNANVGKKVRVSRLVKMHADKKEEIKEVGAGDIAAAVGLENTVTGNTLCGESKVLLLEAIEFPETVISQAIEPKTNEDKEKLRNALEKLKVQDPSFEHRIDRETGQMIIAGMGELHLEILVERLRSEYKVNIETRQQKVAYRETIKNTVNDIKYLHKKQTGGAGERAEVHLDFEPVINNEITNPKRVLNDAEKKAEIQSIQENLNRWGIKLEELGPSNRNFESEINQLGPQQLVELKKIHDRVEREAWEKRKKKYSVITDKFINNEFIDAIRGEDIPKQFRPAVKDGLENVFSRGVLLGYPIVDVKVTLRGGAWHSVDSSYQAFERAGCDAFKENVEKFELVLLEPIMKVEVSTPSDYYGNVLGDLNRRRGEIEKEEEVNQTKNLYAKVPLVEMFGYSTQLRSLTQGRASYSMEFSHYQEVPGGVLQKIIKERKLS
jgi:elongation factor G